MNDNLLIIKENRGLFQEFLKNPIMIPCRINSNNNISVEGYKLSYSRQTTNYAFHMFDGKSNTIWSTNNSMSDWFQIDFINSININHYEIMLDQPSITRVEKIYGSNNGTNFTLLNAITHTLSKNVKKTVKFFNVKEYRYYRIVIEGNSITSEVSFGYYPLSFNEITLTKANMSKIFERNPNIYTSWKDLFRSKNYILQNYVDENNLRSQKLTRKPLSIKFD